MKKFLFLLILISSSCYATEFKTTQELDDPINYKNPTLEQLKGCDWEETKVSDIYHVSCKDENGKIHRYKVIDDANESISVLKKKNRRKNESYTIRKLDNE